MNLNIEFRYFDKSTCSRCKATDKSIQKSLAELKKAASELKISFKETRLQASQMHLSPSITINRQDVEQITGENKQKKNACTCCSELVGEQAECRTYIYKGKKYDYIPKEMIIEAIQRIAK